MLILYGIWFFTVSFIPLVATIIFYFKFKKHIKFVPVLIAAFVLVLVVRDVVLYMPPGRFVDRFLSFFSHKVSVSFYVFYLPIALFGILYPCLFYLPGKISELVKRK